LGGPGVLSVPMRAALILVVVLAGCPGPGPAAGGNGGNGSNGSGKAEQPDGTSARPTGDPATDLRTLVDEVVALVRGAGCPAFGGKLKSWTEKHRQHIGDLIAALEQSGDAAAATGGRAGRRLRRPARRRLAGLGGVRGHDRQLARHRRVAPLPRGHPC